MSRLSILAVAAALACAAPLIAPAPAVAQVQDPAGSPAQREAMQRLSWMDGEWRGTATVMAGMGRTRDLRHTERIGPMLGGSIKVIEGRSYGDDGGTEFNAFAILSWDAEKNAYVMRSYANGMAIDAPVQVSDGGFDWTVPARGGEVRYHTRYDNGVWTESGDFVMPGQEPMRVIDMRLTRTGDSDWPAAGAVTPTP